MVKIQQCFIIFFKPLRKPKRKRNILNWIEDCWLTNWHQVHRGRGETSRTALYWWVAGLLREFTRLVFGSCSGKYVSHHRSSVKYKLKPGDTTTHYLEWLPLNNRLKQGCGATSSLLYYRWEYKMVQAL